MRDVKICMKEVMNIYSVRLKAKVTFKGGEASHITYINSTHAHPRVANSCTRHYNFVTYCILRSGEHTDHRVRAKLRTFLK